MRIRLDAITTDHLERVAMQEGRTHGDAARVLIAEAVRAARRCKASARHRSRGHDGARPDGRRPLQRTNPRRH